jgi:hypothetical protein
VTQVAHPERRALAQEIAAVKGCLLLAQVAQHQLGHLGDLRACVRVCVRVCVCWWPHASSARARQQRMCLRQRAGTAHSCASAVHRTPLAARRTSLTPTSRSMSSSSRMASFSKRTSRCSKISWLDTSSCAVNAAMAIMARRPLLSSLVWISFQAAGSSLGARPRGSKLWSALVRVGGGWWWRQHRVACVWGTPSTHTHTHTHTPGCARWLAKRTRAQRHHHTHRRLPISYSSLRELKPSPVGVAQPRPTR